jgi:hypothetical protein
MKKVIIVMIIMFLGLPATADECKSKLTGLSAYFYSKGDEWALKWMADGVHKEKAHFYDHVKEPYRTNVYDSQGNMRADRLPHALLSPGKQFNVPFEISQNNNLLIAAIHKKSGVMSAPNQLAIVDLKGQQIIRTIESEYNIESLAWAPDDNVFVVLYRQDVTKQVFKGPIDALAEHIGHGNYYWTFYLTIYRPDGTAVCTEKIAKKLPNAMSYLDWGKPISTSYESDTDSAWVKNVKRTCASLGEMAGSSAYNSRKKAEPLNLYYLHLAAENADAYDKAITNNVTVKIYEGVYANKSIDTEEQAAREGVRICVDSWLTFDPTGEKQAASIKNQR